VTQFSEELIARSGYERAGFADRYDRHRPRPPRALLELLCRFARSAEPKLVVDLGCGTGLSARAWSGVARRVIGVEPNPAMLGAAEEAPGVEYRTAYAQATGIDDGAADMVTCSQSFHWMEAEPTLAEAARILRRGGVFAAYDYDLPPAVDPEVDTAFAEYLARRREARARRSIRQGADRWSKDKHLERIRESGLFGFCREVVLHSVEKGDAERVGGLARSLGLPIAEPDDPELARELRIDELEEAARRILGSGVVPFVFGYRVRLGVLRRLDEI
jgi:SAM-dependent methyltransferase